MHHSFLISRTRLSFAVALAGSPNLTGGTLHAVLDIHRFETEVDHCHRWLMLPHVHMRTVRAAVLCTLQPDLWFPQL